MKRLKKTCAVTLSAAMVLGMVAGNGTICLAAENIEKDETVYVNQTADGAISEITVSDWLKNVTGNGDISDVSNLKNIKNVKGDETFTNGNDGKITWKADNADIYYQGTSDEELPIGVSISYKLDGKDIKPEELAGKSGRLTITIQYTNHSTYEDNIGGKTMKMNTPFLMASAVILPVDNFSNVEISQGKMVSEGSNQILLAYGMPGFSDSLQLSDDMKDDLEESIGDIVTITADTTDCAIEPIYTVATSDIISELEIDEGGDIDDLENAVNDLVDATDELISGSTDLSDGLTTLQDNFKTYASGVNDVSKGASDLSAGAGKLSEGITQYTDGVTTLTGGAATYVNGTKSLAAGVTQYVNGEKQLSAGAATLSNGVSSFASQYDKLQGGFSQYVNTVNGIADMLGTLPEMMGGVQQGMEKVGTSLGAASAACTTQETRDYSGVLSALESMAADENTSDADKQTINSAIRAIEALQGDVSEANGKIGKAKEGIGAASQTVAAVAGNMQQSAVSVSAEDIKKLKESGNTLLSSAQALNDQGVVELSKGSKSLCDGFKQLDANNDTLLSGAKQLTDNSVNLTNGIAALNVNTKTLTDSAKTLSQGAKKLNSGANKLNQSTGDVTDGIHKLQSGSVELKDGTQKMKDEGTGKLRNEFNDKVKTALERFQSLAGDEAGYKSFSGIADGMEGSVKFIIQTEGVSAKKN